MQIVIESFHKKFNSLESSLKKNAKAALLFLSQKDASIDIVLVSSSILDKNVLSFEHPHGFPMPKKSGKYLGQVYLNPDYIKKHGEDLEFMLIHGILHLLGYEHDTKNGIMKMEAQEKKVINFLRTFNP